jgi:hypothetical protein
MREKGSRNLSLRGFMNEEDARKEIIVLMQLLENQEKQLNMFKNMQNFHESLIHACEEWIEPELLDKISEYARSLMVKVEEK